MTLSRSALALFALTLGSCSSTQLMTLSVQKPSPVTMPAPVHSVALVDRRAIDPRAKITDAVDRIFSLEGPGLDSAGAAQSISGLRDALQREERFSKVVILKEQLTTLNPTQFPTPLSWDVVESLCRNSEADALFSLELFDTDSRISYAAHPVKLNTVFGSIPAIEQEATMRTNVKAGWRIYYPASKEVVDEFAVARDISYSGRGINPVAAAGALIGRKEAVKAVGYEAGKGYATRIIPYWIRVSRDYYVKGTDRFTVAKRKAQAGNWDQAAKLWEEETHNPKAKIAGRACYNMAIIHEINGNLPEAIHWAQTAYGDYNNRLALRYVNVLKRRQAGDDLLREQQSSITLDR